ncbi:Competence protein A [Desulfitobacterium dichloroeliminans LMG P-21439]|uniref:Competence protein A n=1 Tax=Desulfitobacterium dichloroeliminans (strain LMG P-21439 / DCA1) TaxID=871963 RepID=L0FB33_DESDL|nr:PilN domain-containing protein [Desulfitobacterium dichloroeliminans]AGA69871.1 Competence protein A [Desulfitobacterium dichloroeliminans LMG P-21439]
MISQVRWKVCVEITADELRWLWCSYKGREGNAIIAVEKFETVPLPLGIIEQGKVQQPGEFLSIVKRYVEERKVEFRLPCHLKLRIGLPIQNQFIREYSLPWARKGDRKGLLNYLAEEEIPIPKKELMVDYLIREEKSSPPRLNVILAGIRKSVLTPLVSSFQAADIEIERVSFSQLVWGNALKFKPQDNTLILRQEAGQILGIYYKGKTPEMIRSVPAAAYSYGEKEWDREIHRLLLHFSSYNEQGDLHRILWGRGSETAELGKRIVEYLHRVHGQESVLQEVDEAFYAAFDKELLQAIPCPEPEKLLTVLGIALDQEKNPLNNFWRGEMRKKKSHRVKTVTAGFLLLINLIGLGMLASSRYTLDNMHNEVNGLREMKANVALAEEQQREQVEAWVMVKNSPTTVGLAMQELSSYNPERIQLERMELKGNNLLMQGVAKESLEVQSVFQDLEAGGWENVVLSNYHVAEKPLVEHMPIQFTLKAVRHE